MRIDRIQFQAFRAVIPQPSASGWESRVKSIGGLKGRDNRATCIQPHADPHSEMRPLSASPAAHARRSSAA